MKSINVKMLGAFVAVAVVLIVLGVLLKKQNPSSDAPVPRAAGEKVRTPGVAASIASSLPDEPPKPATARPPKKERPARPAAGAEKTPGAASARAADDELSEARIQAVEAWEGFIDRVAERENAPTEAQASQFKREFNKLDKADQLDGIQTALNLLPDEQFALLYPILFDKSVDPDILDAIFSDGLNHDDEIKIPMMKAIYEDKEHPLYEEAERILDATGELDNAPEPEEKEE
ncbi:MAG: hypothetical protein LBW77_00250 [Verrucomicrobiota bacterium]|jgi:hypothetical protein|nr:hypothetical protein [Verrucomicrobiota bacterium]